MVKSKGVNPRMHGLLRDPEPCHSGGVDPER